MSQTKEEQVLRCFFLSSLIAEQVLQCFFLSSLVAVRSLAEIRMLRWFCGHTRRNRVWNKAIRKRVRVAPIEEKFTQHQLRWFGHVQRRHPEAPVRSGVLKRVDKIKRGRGRSKLTWDGSVKRDFKDWDISEELALDRSAWRLAFNVPEL